MFPVRHPIEGPPEVIRFEDDDLTSWSEFALTSEIHDAVVEGLKGGDGTCFSCVERGRVAVQGEGVKSVFLVRGEVGDGRVTGGREVRAVGYWREESPRGGRGGEEGEGGVDRVTEGEEGAEKAEQEVREEVAAAERYREG